MAAVVAVARSSPCAALGGGGGALRCRMKPVDLEAESRKEADEC